MAPATSLPISDEFKDVEEYVESLLQFATSSTLFQTLCGGVHILDFFTREPSLYDAVTPEDWRPWLADCQPIELLDLVMRDDLQDRDSSPDRIQPPASLLQYVRDIRKHSLRRSFIPRPLRQKTLPRHVSVGMIPKKMHEVINFADYVVNLADEIEAKDGHSITHFVDFGSGQNYLGRALASPPYNKNIVAVESKKLNIKEAKSMDVFAKLSERETVLRNKKLYRQKMDSMVPAEQLNEKALRRAARPQKSLQENGADLRPNRDLTTTYIPCEGKGRIQYVEQIVNNGDLSVVIQQISDDGKSADQQLSTNHRNIQISSETKSVATQDEGQIPDPRLMAISVHSCVQAIAIVGCCYNLLTERLGPSTYKLPLLRANLRPFNARVAREAAAYDPHGFPMSSRVGAYGEDGIRLNVTARMMAVQAPQNWTEKESDAFFTRHFFRALLQKVFLDRGVIARPQSSSDAQESLFNQGTDPVIIGSLRKSCYASFQAYVRGAIAKLITNPALGADIGRKMEAITDEELNKYAERYGPRKKELSFIWSLMAFSAGVAESVIVVDRWQYLREHGDVVGDCWVEAIFDYQQSPRNLVVVGVKK